jgi:hypothetical protein
MPNFNQFRPLLNLKFHLFPLPSFPFLTSAMERTTEVDSNSHSESDAARKAQADDESEDEDVFHDAHFPAEEEEVSSILSLHSPQCIA